MTFGSYSRNDGLTTVLQLTLDTADGGRSVRQRTQCVSGQARGLIQINGFANGPGTVDRHANLMAVAGNTGWYYDNRIDIGASHMKLTFGMKGESLAHGFAAILLGSAMLVSVANADNDAVVQTAGGVSYVSGGVGTDSIDRLKSLSGDFNLKLVFALNSGEYLSGVRVAIADAAGKAVLDATSEGPWFLIRLPAGNYQVVATLAGKATRRQVAVNAAGLRTVDFRWASE
jgi:hypothetical protein